MAAREVQLILVRHAIAEESGPAWPDDGQRPLTRDGARKWKAAARGLASLVPAVDALLTSPLVRAVQTAEVLSRALVPSPRLVLCDALQPGATPQVVLASLRQRHLEGTVVLVGHEPSLSELAGALLHAQGAIEFRKGAALALTTRGLGQRGPARLDWFLPPRALRALRR